MKNRFFKRYYYTLADLVELCESTLPTEYNTGKFYDYGLLQIVYSVLNVSASDLDNVIKSTEVATLWSTYLAPYRLEEFITFRDNSEITEADDAHYVKWIRLLLNRIHTTYEKYKVLLDFYSAQKANLLQAIKASNTIRFNDTPQNGGDFTADSYTSTYTKSNSETDANTLMARLDEISRLYKNLWLDWSHEFDDLFFSTPEGDF